MAEPLKNSFGPEIPQYVAGLVGAVWTDFDRTAFVATCLDGLDELELMPRAAHIAGVMAAHLPQDRGAALTILIDALAAELERNGGFEELTGMDAFRYLPLVRFVGVHGLDHFEPSMVLQYELTQRFTAEFSIRPFLEHHETATLARLHQWTSDPSEHVRRLVSEGTRPRLPWAPRLRRYVADPAPVIELLERLRDDESEYVRRSVANNLNDIAKDHPGVAVEIARRWWPDVVRSEGDRHRRRLVTHALRTLIKQGDPEALGVLGYGSDCLLEVVDASVAPATVSIGQSVWLSLALRNPTDLALRALVDLRVHFVKANGRATPKVFKGAAVDVEPGESVMLAKTVSLRQHTTRTHYPGRHDVEVLVNGDARPLGSFTLQP